MDKTLCTFVEHKIRRLEEACNRKPAQQYEHNGMSVEGYGEKTQAPGHSEGDNDPALCGGRESI